MENDGTEAEEKVEDLPEGRNLYKHVSRNFSQPRLVIRIIESSWLQIMDSSGHEA